MVQLPFQKWKCTSERHFDNSLCSWLFIGLSQLIPLQAAWPYSSDTNGNSASIWVDSFTKPSDTNGLGHWIWEKVTLNKQTCRLWREFDIPANLVVTNAEMRIAADNGFKLWLDGREIGQGSDWRTLSVYDFTELLPSGKHVLAVEGFNDVDKAGVIGGLTVKYSDGTALHVKTDSSWRLATEAGTGWQRALRPSDHWAPARIVAAIGDRGGKGSPWWTQPTAVVHIRPPPPDPVKFWQSKWFQFILIVVCGAALATSLGLWAELAIQSKAQNLVQGERARIAMDIHDELGSRVTQILLSGEVAQRRTDYEQRAARELRQTCEGMREVLGSIDEIVWLVNSQRDTLSEFAGYICKYAQTFLAPAAIRCRFDVDSGLLVSTLHLSVRRNLLLAVKEALNNVAKHSKATEAFLRIRCANHSLILVVEDNGDGFDASKTDAMRNGLPNMARRLKALGGFCLIDSKPGRGCRVEFRLPLKQIQPRLRLWFPWPRQRRQRLEKPSGSTQNNPEMVREAKL